MWKGRVIRYPRPAVRGRSRRGSVDPDGSSAQHLLPPPRPSARSRRGRRASSSRPERRWKTSAPSASDAEATRAANGPARPTARAAAADARACSLSPVRTGVCAETQIRGSAASAWAASRSITRPRTETSQLSGPRRSTATGRSGTTTIRKRVREGAVVARARRLSGARRPSAARPPRRARRGPSDERRERRAHLGRDRGRAAADVDPVDREERRLARERVAAERERRGCRSRSRASGASARTRRAAPDGSTSGSSARAAAARTPPHAQWTVRERALAGTFRISPRGAGSYSVGQLELAEELDLVLEPDAELLVRATPRLGHEGERVRRRRAAGVLDEVRVLRRDLGAADPVPLEAARLEHPPRAQLVLRVLEHAAERALVRRLRLLAARVELAHLRLDLVARAAAAAAARPAGRPGRAGAPSAGRRARARPASASRCRRRSRRARARARRRSRRRTRRRSSRRRRRSCRGSRRRTRSRRARRRARGGGRRRSPPRRRRAARLRRPRRRRAPRRA